MSRGTRPYNEDTYQAGTIEVPAFAKRAPISLSRRPGGKETEAGNKDGATSADSASGDPQVFFFGVYDGHGGHECSDFLKEELHVYIEDAAELFELGSSLRKVPKKTAEQEVEESSADKLETAGSDLSATGKESLSAVDMKSGDEVKEDLKIPEQSRSGKMDLGPADPAKAGEDPVPQEASKPKALELETSLVQQWSDTVGGYFRRFKPEFFDLSAIRSRSRPGSASNRTTEPTNNIPISMETVLMYAFLRADLDFVTAQASKPDPDSATDAPLNNDEILGSPSKSRHLHSSSSSNKSRIGGPARFKGGSTASVAMISTPTPTPFWHPASPSTLLVAHVGDTRILLCETSTGLAIPATTNHHPSSPIESSRLRRYAATFVTDSFGEERMSGLANTRAFGDMRSKRIGVSAEPELSRYELGPAQYSFLVLVSDGVSGTLSDQEIVDVVKEARTPEQGARDVVGFATEVSREGDNATCLVVRLGGWERRGEGGMGSLGTKEVRDFRRVEATDPRTRRT